MHLKTSRHNNLLIRFDAGAFDRGVTQADMPMSTWEPGQRDVFGKNEAVIYRIFSEHRERSAFFKHAFTICAQARHIPNKHVFHEVGANRRVKLEIDQSQMTSLCQQRRIEAVVGSYNDVLAETPFASAVRAPKLSISGHGVISSDANAQTPSVMLWNEIEVPHLEHRTMGTVVAGQDVACSISYSSHCWTVGLTEGMPAIAPIIVDEVGAPRMISLERHDHSFDLPEMMERLKSFRVYRTRQHDNFGVFSAHEGGQEAYTAFFSVERSMREGLDFDIRVRSAYVAPRPSKSALVDLPSVFHAAFGKRFNPNFQGEDE